MRIALVGRHAPLPEGTPTGRVMHALGEGLVAEGHELVAWSWAPEEPAGELPDWCEWRPLPGEAFWRTRARALVRPRHDIVRAGWSVPEGFVGLADEPLSWGAVAGAPAGAAVTFHYLTRLDGPVLRRPNAHDAQDRRHERFAARRAPLPLAFSERVGQLIAGERAVVVPIAYAPPPEPLPLVDAPVALLFANWEWPPNAKALATMLEAWPLVRASVPGARLVLAGWGLDRMGVGHVAGVEAVGPVARAADALARASVLAFPCPPTSGPKVKVLEALAHGVPVVTTPAGAEGIRVRDGEGAVVTTAARFADALTRVLADPAWRASLAASGRAAVLREHAPRVAARARVAALEAAFGRDGAEVAA